MKSASYPGAIRPQTDSMPTDCAGVREAMRRASAGLTRPQSTTFLTPCLSSKIDPARLPVSLRRAVPSLTTTSNSPRRDWPSPIPPARIQSVIRTVSLGPLARVTTRAAAGWTWWPSQIISAKTLSKLKAAPTIPGLRWWRPLIPL